MPILIIFAFAFIYLLFFGAELYVRSTLRKYASPRDDLQGNGSDLIDHLMKQEGVTGVGVELTRVADHYDATKQTIRLQEAYYKGKSLTGVAVAAFEFAHAFQHFHENLAFKNRLTLLSKTKLIERWAAGLILTAPAIFYLVRSTHLMLGCLALGLIMISARALVHLFTLPLEHEAATKALSLLETGVNAQDLQAVKSLLKALEIKQLASALAEILNPWAWVTLFKRSS
jgi:uncharacterized protein